jgi:hypothetical protein
MGVLKPTGGALILVLAVLLAARATQACAQCERANLTDDNGQAGDKFAYSVAISDQVVMVGAPWDDDRGDNYGSTFVFARAGDAWSEAQKLPAEGSAILAGFGRSVGLDGSAAVIGVRGPQTAYVFEWSAGAWHEGPELVPDDWWFGSFYGERVALSGDFAAVGAPHDDQSGYRSGSAYIFEREPNGVWSQAAKLLPDDGEPYNKFGYAVALCDGVAVIGAPGDNDQGNYSGSAYVFERDLNGVWWQAAKLLASDGGPFTGYANALAVCGDLVMIGAADAEGNEPHAGSAYVYERDPNGAWPEVAKLIADDGCTSDFFGCSVALSGSVAVIGADGVDDLGNGSGAAYVFVRQTNGTWSQVAKVMADDGAAYDRFGNAVAVSGNSAVIGAYLDDDQGEDAGSAYIFAVGPDEDGDGIMDVCQLPGTPTQATKGHQGLSAGRQSPMPKVRP